MERAQSTKLRILLFAVGSLDVAALVFLFFPVTTISQVNGFLLGEAYPTRPIALHLLYASVLLYAHHGGVLLYLAGDTIKFSGLIRFVGILTCLHAACLVGVGYGAGMPIWWICLEGPLFFTLGLLMVYWSPQKNVETES